MIRGLEFAGFVALAAAVHAGIWTATPEGGGAGGDSGADTVTLAASTPQMAALVEAWQRPVAVQEAVPAPRPAPTPDTRPVALRPEAEHARAPAPDALPESGRAPDRPQIDSTPLPLPAPRVDTRAPSASRPPEVPQQASPMPPKAPAAAAARPTPPDAPRAPTMATLPRADRTPPASQAPSPPSTRPRARPVAPAPARQQDVASGTGGAQAGGQAQTAAARIDDATRASLMGQWGGAIRTRIERHKRYPSGTRASGTAHLVLDVADDGRLLGVDLRRSSGDARLDSAALTAVRRARLPAAPDRLPGTRHRFNLPVAFSR